MGGMFPLQAITEEFEIILSITHSHIPNFPGGLQQDTEWNLSTH